jgi:hypothetical protein
MLLPAIGKMDHYSYLNAPEVDIHIKEILIKKPQNPLAKVHDTLYYLHSSNKCCDLQKQI